MTKSTKIIAALGVAAGLGIAALPAGSIFADELVPIDYGTTTGAAKDVTVSLNVGEAIAIAVESNTCNAGNTSIKSTTNCSQKVAGGTNAVNGFTLSVKDKDADLNLNLNGTAGQTGNNTIEAQAGALGGTTWQAGWNLTGGALSNAAITAAEQTVIKTNAPKDAQISMTYNIATKPNQTTGNYSDIITYTIAKNQTAVATEEGL